jgi:AraC-like DNA-binding protein
MRVRVHPSSTGSRPAEHPTLTRLIGSTPPVLRAESVDISTQLRLEVVEADAESASFEEHGRLLFLPVEGSLSATDGEACRAGLQLHYLRRSKDERTALLTSLHFHPDFLAQWPAEALASTFAFRRDLTTEHQITLSTQTEALLDELAEAMAAEATLSSLLRRSEIATALLRRALDAIATPFSACAVPACRFLAYESEREKIFLARDILEGLTDERPLTIKDLARKVAMNECYLKKGFKALTGKTVYDFQHERRIARAQQLLQEEGRSVSEVAQTLRFSSISHFSTAFKKATGLKPCELLK